MSFAEEVGRWTAKAEGRMDLVLQKVCLDLLSSVVVGRPVGIGTPVDTGRARGAWMVGIGAYFTGESKTLDKAGASTIQRGQGVLNGARAGQVIFITNNVPYIRVLEYGRADGKPGSPQAPNGMVRVAIAAYPGIVVKRANEANRG